MAPDALKKELDGYLSAHPETRYLETLTVDMNGILRGKRAQRDDFGKLFQGGMNLCAATAILDSRGNTFDSRCWSRCTTSTALRIRVTRAMFCRTHCNLCTTWVCAR